MDCLTVNQQGNISHLTAQIEVEDKSESRSDKGNAFRTYENPYP